MTHVGDLCNSISIDTVGLPALGLYPQDRIDELGQEDTRNLAFLAAAKITES